MIIRSNRPVQFHKIILVVFFTIWMKLAPVEYLSQTDLTEYQYCYGWLAF